MGETLENLSTELIFKTGHIIPNNQTGNRGNHFFKNIKPDYPELLRDGILIARLPSTKHLGVYLDTRLNF